MSNKYNSSLDNRELMIFVLSKAKKLLEEAKQHLIEKDYITLPKKILKVVDIAQGLALTVTVKDEIPGSKETFDMFQNLMFLIENLIASKAKPSEYDYYIEHFEKLKNKFQDFTLDNDQTKFTTDSHYHNNSSDNKINRPEKIEFFT